MGITTNIIKGDLETKLSLKNEKIQKRILNYEGCLILLGYIGYEHKKDELICVQPNLEKVIFLNQQLKEIISQQESKKEDLLTISEKKDSNMKENSLKNFKSFFVQDVGLLPEKQKFELPEKYQCISVLGVGTYGIVM